MAASASAAIIFARVTRSSSLVVSRIRRPDSFRLVSRYLTISGIPPILPMANVSLPVRPVRPIKRFTEAASSGERPASSTIVWYASTFCSKATRSVLVAPLMLCHLSKSNRPPSAWTERRYGTRKVSVALPNSTDDPPVTSVSQASLPRLLFVSLSLPFLVFLNVVSNVL